MYVISGVDYSLGFEWLNDFLDQSRYEVCFVFLNDKEPSLHKLFLDKGVNSHFFALRSKFDFPILLFKLCRLIHLYKPNIVHTHLFEANLLGITAAWCMGVKKRVYTRHHSTFHIVYHPHMVKYDRYVNYLSTHIASISLNVSDVLIHQEGVKKEKVFLVRHGFDLDRFRQVSGPALELLKAKYNVHAKRPVIGVISRFTEWKGIQYILPAFGKLLQQYPDALLVLANAKGEYGSVIDSMLEKLPVDSYVKIPFERDLFSLYQLFDIFVHVPVDGAAEAFGQVYVEALAAGVPSVFTLSGIAQEFIVDKKNALVVPFKDSAAILEALMSLLQDDVLRKTIVDNGRKVVFDQFMIGNMMNALYEIYED